MQTAHCLLSLGGDHGNQVMKHGVTAAEIAVLRAIHGDEAVQEVEPAGHVKRTHREERERLLGTYGAAKSDEQVPIVANMFPGVAARVFENIGELGLPDSYFKATGRLRADTAAAADEPAYDPSAPLEIDETGLRGDDAPATEHDAPVDEAEDGVGEDINDGHGEPNVLG